MIKLNSKRKQVNDQWYMAKFKPKGHYMLQPEKIMESKQDLNQSLHVKKQTLFIQKHNNWGVVREGWQIEWYKKTDAVRLSREAN